MSIVGTRPPLISETNLYEPRHKATAVWFFPAVIRQWERMQLLLIYFFTALRWMFRERRSVVR